MAGPAFTVKASIGDYLPVLRAIVAAQPGQVLVIDCGGTERATSWGGTGTVAAVTRGLAGCVTNTSIRDIDEIREQRFPVFALGASLRGITKSDRGLHNIPVSVGGIVVRPGDWVIGDSDGVVVVPAERAEAVAKSAVEKRAEEVERERRIAEGEPIWSEAS